MNKSAKALVLKEYPNAVCALYRGAYTVFLNPLVIEGSRANSAAKSWDKALLNMHKHHTGAIDSQ